MLVKITMDLPVHGSALFDGRDAKKYEALYSRVQRNIQEWAHRGERVITGGCDEIGAFDAMRRRAVSVLTHPVEFCLTVSRGPRCYQWSETAALSCIRQKAPRYSCSACNEDLFKHLRHSCLN